MQLCCAACNDLALAEDAPLRAQLAAARDTLAANALAAVVQSARAVPALTRSIWLAPDEARAAAAVLQRAVAERREEAGALMREIIAMQCALDAHAPPHAVALLLPSRWLALAKHAREEALASESRLRTAIPPCGHRIARSYCAACLDGMGLLHKPEDRRPRGAGPRPGPAEPK